MVSADRRVVELQRQSESLRAELASLRHALSEMEAHLDGTRAAHLLEANQQLVLTALRADEIADAALANLGTLSRSSQLDELTETATRALMLDRMTNAIAVARRHRRQLAVLFFDLDDFKQINDTLGHA